MIDWIPVSEGLPEKSADFYQILVTNGKGLANLIWTRGDGYGQAITPDYEITHWVKVNPPKEGIII